MPMTTRVHLYLILIILGVIALGLIVFFKFNCCSSEDPQADKSHSRLCSDAEDNEGWTCLNDYDGSYLRVFDIETDWKNAEEMCLSDQQQDAHLVSIINKNQNERLKELIRQTNFSNCEYYWIGADWDHETDKYRWTDGTNTTEYLTKKLDAQLRSYGASARIAVNSQMDWATLKASSSACYICAWDRMNSVENATDCSDLKKFGKKRTGLYTVKIDNLAQRHKILCEMDHSDGGWTVFQQRFDGKLAFWNRTWQEYRNGFGIVGKQYEFWAGNELLHQLTSKNKRTWLRVELWGDRNPNSTNPDGYWESEYQEFRLGDESTDYTLHIEQRWGSVKGNASETWFDITYASGFKFSTVDRINDPQPECVTRYHLGGWWLHYCTFSALNGEYEPPYRWSDGYGMMWITAGLHIINPRISRMMLKKES